MSGARVMHENELRAAANCAFCRKPFGNSGLPLFYRMRVERWGVDAQAVRRQQGLTMMLGGHAQLAAIMGPDEPMAKVISSVEVTVCETCAPEASLYWAVEAGRAEAEGQ